jgi:hypothetical protein
MASQDHIRNPIEWACDQLWLAARTVGSLGRALEGSQESREASLPSVCRIKIADLKDVLVRGLDDFGAYRPTLSSSASSTRLLASRWRG